MRYTPRRDSCPSRSAIIETRLPMNALAQLIDAVFSIYIYLLIASALVSWLVAFNVINTQNKFVYQVLNFLYRITEPALRPIRRIIPNLGGIDLSPIILILLLYFIRNLIIDNLV
jgi:YggT family protein